ncbi:MAG TPA: hypothetical protein VFZ26_02845 [Gemmatimonadales bacterium]
MPDPTPTGVALPARPARVCRMLLETLEVSEGRRRRRKRDTTPDAIGLGIKRRLLEEAVRADPDPDGFEGWLLGACLEEGVVGRGVPSGPVRAMALEILADWRLAQRSGVFRHWLERGAMSDDRP